VEPEMGAKDIINKTTRHAFQEIMVGSTLGEINALFQNQDFASSQVELPHVNGQRRTLVAQYYAAIDFRNLSEIKRLVCVYDEIVDDLERAIQRSVAEGDQLSQYTTLSDSLADLLKKMSRDGFERVNGQFQYQANETHSLPLQALTLTQSSVTEHLEKARSKLANEDYSGAIASAYTLVEALLKALLKRVAPSFNENEGDIRQLYNQLKGPMNLDAKEATIDRFLKAILDGLQKQLGGLYELANKASDRHARRYNPARHHAKLAVNCALTLCEFLLESYEHQQELQKKKIIL
jgi:hypothetical protein